MAGNLEKTLFMVCGGVVVAAGIFGAGLYSGVRENAAFEAVAGVARPLVQLRAEWQNIVPGGDPVDFLQRARHDGDGVTVNRHGDDGNLVMISGFFDGDTETRLMRRDGTVLARWPVRFSEHFPDPGSFLPNPPQTDRNVDLHGALLLPDGSLVFNYEYSGTVKLDRCGNTVWTLEHPTHHSVETSETGGFWIPGRAWLTAADRDLYPPFTETPGEVPIADDLILKVSDEGEIVTSRSVTRILYDSGLEPLMTATGFSFTDRLVWDRELVHLNKIAELPAALADRFAEFEAGDLLLSLRQYNLVLVVDPDTWQVRWHRTGPWLRQHDPEFMPDGTIAVFDNNAYRIDLLPRGRADPDVPRDSRILRADPARGTVDTVYGARPGEEFATVVRGKLDPTPGGGFLITEHEAGRIFEVDADGTLVWEHVSRFDADRVLEVTEGRVYPESYFTVADWDCP